jgi:hypothetical protein
MLLVGYSSSGDLKVCWRAPTERYGKHIKIAEDCVASVVPEDIPS